MTNNNEKLQVLSELVNRLVLARQMGMSFGDKRDLFQTLGYPDLLTFQDYYSHWKRNAIAKTLINRPAFHTWAGDLVMVETNEANDTQFEAAWKKLDEDFKLKTLFLRADKMCHLGRYSILLLGFNDVNILADFKNEVKGSPKLLYIKPLSENSAKVEDKDLEKDPSSPRYGFPAMYDITLKEGVTFPVHHSRVIHVTDELMESEWEGVPFLESVFNNLIDLIKLVGGSAEMFWKGARPGMGGKMDENYTMTPTDEAKLQAQFDEYEHGLRRFLLMEGVDLKEMAAQVTDPSKHFDIQIQVISAVTNIPKRILTGSERGELASSQDQDEWAGYLQTRREEFAEIKIVRPFVNKMIELKILPSPKVNYTIQWRDLFAASEQKRVTIGKDRATALKEYASAPAAEAIVPPDAFFEFFLGLDQDQITLIQQMKDKAIQDGFSEDDDDLIEDIEPEPEPVNEDEAE